MKTFIYTYRRNRNDVNGNPRHFADVWRVERNQPRKIFGDLDIGYRSPEQAIIEELKSVGELPKTAPPLGYGLAESGIAKLIQL